MICSEPVLDFGLAAGLATGLASGAADPAWVPAGPLDAQVISMVAHTTLTERLSGAPSPEQADQAGLSGQPGLGDNALGTDRTDLQQLHHLSFAVTTLASTASTMNDAASWAQRHAQLWCTEPSSGGTAQAQANSTHSDRAHTDRAHTDSAGGGEGQPTNAAVAWAQRRAQHLGQVGVVLADEQTGGRGRRQRNWATPPGSGLALSLVVRLDQIEPRWWGWLPLLSGLAAAQASSRLTGVPVQLKWPNDVLIGGRKLAGVLVEQHHSAMGPLAVIGIGMNVGLSAEQLPVQTATSLRVAGAAPTDRNILAGRIVGEVVAWHHQWKNAGGDAQACGLARQYLEHSATVGSHVQVQLPDHTQVIGQAVGLDHNAALQVQHAGGITSFAAADVHHLRPVGR